MSDSIFNNPITDPFGLTGSVTTSADMSGVYTPDQINLQPSSSVAMTLIPSDVTNLSGDLLSGYSWTLDASRVLTYSFYDSNVFPDGSYYGIETGVHEVSENIKDNVRSILNWLEKVINVNFVEVTETASTYGQLRVMDSNLDAAPNAAAYANYPWSATDPLCGDVHLESSGDFYDPLTGAGFQAPAGFGGYETLIHELGHALGLKHPFDEPNVLPAALSNTTNTVMTYNTFGLQAGTGVDLNIAGTYMPLDIAALQSLYDPREKNTGNDTYLFNDVSHYTVNGQAELNGTYPTKQTIWDTGGIDTLDLSKLAFDGTGYRIDMNEGGILCKAALYNTCRYTDYKGDQSINDTTVELTAIAYGVTLENLIGSSSNDFIIGNSANNILNGGAGTDTAVYGAWANYTVIGNSTSATISDSTGADGTDTLNSIEYLTFNGVTVTTEAAVNDAPVGVSDNNASDPVIEAGTGVVGDSSAIGNVLSNDTDADSALGLGETKTVKTVNNQNSNVGSTVAGLYGSLVLLADGNYTYTLDNTKAATNALSTGQVVTDTFTYTVVDAHGASSAPTTLSINITGSNDAPTFFIGNADGKVTTDFGSLSVDGGSSVTVQTDGKILVAGYSTIGGSYDFALTRYNVDGSLDTSFDSDGKVTTDLDSSSDDFGSSVTVQADGKILVAGWSSGFGFALTRYNVNGSLDTSFDADGKVTTDFGSLSSDDGYSVTVQADGKILVAGYSNVGGSVSYDFALTRYNADGSLDTSFDGDGKVTTDFDASSFDYSYSVTVQADGKILVAGSSNVAYFYDFNFALARYNIDGSLDTSFDADGKVTTDFGSLSRDIGYSVTVQADGKILVSGYSNVGGSYDFALARYNVDGSLDTSFDSDGIVTTDFGSLSRDIGRSVTVQADGKILVAGFSDVSGSDDFALTRYNVDGSLDTSFDTDGKVTTNFGSLSYDKGYSVTVQADGKILVAGESNVGGSFDFALARYNTDGSLDTTFGVQNILAGTVAFIKGGAAVVLDSYVTVSDVELNATNYNGATLTLARHGGANAQDIFSSAAFSGTDVVVSSTHIGTISQNSGTLNLSFNANATQTLVNSALRQIAYSNNADTPPASVQVDWTFNDGNTGAQGTGGALTALGSTFVAITAQNNAPTLDIPATVNYIDTAFVDSFTPATGTLQGHDVDAGTVLTYGITGGTDNGTTVNKANAYGTLTVTKATGAYNFVANSAAIEPLGAAASDNTLNVTVSDGTLNTSQPFTVNITQQGVTETNGNDILTGTGAASNNINALAGDDLLDGGVSDVYNPGVIDTLNGGAGNDTFLVRGFFGAGNYTGGAGTDLLDFSQSDAYTAGRRVAEGAGVKVDLSAGTATTYYLQASNFTWVDANGQIKLNTIENITGTNQSDSLTGDASNINILNGGAGNDILIGKGGNDTLIGGTGNDTYVIDALTYIITEQANEGIDTVQSSVSGYTLDNNLENLTLIGTATIGTGNAQDNILLGNTVSNTLNGGAGNDTLDGGASDVYNPGVIDTLNGDAGNDTFLSRGFFGAGIYNGGADTDLLDFSQSDAYTAGRRSAEGAGVKVDLSAGTASTYYLRASGFTWLDANGQLALTGIENVLGSTQSDLITGDANANVLDGGVSDVYNPTVTDVLNGGAGDDTFLARGFFGAGIYTGGAGTDLLDFSQSDAYTAGRRVAEGAGVKVDLSAGTATTYYLQASNFTWTDPNGQIKLYTIENITGSNQGDSLTGDANVNILNGGAGNDILTGKGGNDTLIGGTGNDTYIVDNTVGYTLTEQANEGIDTVQASVDYSLGINTQNIENLTLIGTATTGTGDALDNVLTGNTVSNTLNGGAGNDTLDGGASDVYNPGVIDTLNGDAGNDTFLSRGFFGAGIYNGGADTDLLNFSQSDAYTAGRRSTEGAGVKVDLSAGTASTYYLRASGFTWLDANGQLALTGIENVLGSTQSDLITGDANANVLDGGVSDVYNPTVTDVLNGGAGDDTFLVRGFFGAGIYTGGAGTDLLDFSQSDAYTAGRRVAEGAGVKVDLSAGTATTYYLQASNFTWTDLNGQIKLNTIENITGTNQSDSLTGDATNVNVLNGGAGNDVLIGKGSNDTLIGGTGNDTYLVDNTVGYTLIEDANAGTDTVQASVNYSLGVNTLNIENLTLIGTATTGTGDALDNVLLGNALSNTLSGGDGNDTLDGGVSDVYNPGVIDTLNGDAGNDTFLVRGFFGAGNYTGGAGTDLIDFSQSDAYTAARRVAEGAGVKVDLSAGTATTYYRQASNFTWADADGQIKLNTIENVTGTNQSDNITGDANANVLDGGVSDVYNPGVIDTLNGGDGNDTFLVRGFFGAGNYTGGTGTDLIDFSQSDAYTAGRRVAEGAGVKVDLSAGTATTYYRQADNFTWADANGQIKLNTIENVTGTNQSDSLTGDANDNILTGGNGADILTGGLGKDTYNLAEVTAATDTIKIAAGDSLVTSYDLANGFTLGSGTISTAGVDKLDLANTTIAANASAVDGVNTGTIMSHSISNGIISFDDVNTFTAPVAVTAATNFADVLSYLQTNIIGGNSVAFVAEGNTFVFQDNGPTDTLVELVGVTAASLNNTGLGVGAVWIV